MFEKLATWYLSRLMRKAHINDLEIVIRSDSNTLRERDLEREKSIKETLSKIK